MDNIGKIAAEVLEIIEYYPEEEKNKIPEELKNNLKNISLPQGACKIDPTKRIEEQSISPYTIILFGMIYREYLATPEEKEFIKKKNEELNNNYFDAKKMFEKLNNGG